MFSVFVGNSVNFFYIPQSDSDADCLFLCSFNIFIFNSIKLFPALSVYLERILRSYFCKRLFAGKVLIQAG
jgi:hypothetical protein